MRGVHDYHARRVLSELGCDIRRDRDPGAVSWHGEHISVRDSGRSDVSKAHDAGYHGQYHRNGNIPPDVPVSWSCSAYLCKRCCFYSVSVCSNTLIIHHNCSDESTVQTSPG